MITKSANKSDVSGNSQSTFMTWDKRKSLLIEYEELSRERNGINPKLSTYQRITEKMALISQLLVCMRPSTKTPLVLADAVGLSSEYDDVVEVGLFLLFSIPVSEDVVGGDGEVGDVHAGRHGAQLRVAGEIAVDKYFVEILHRSRFRSLIISPSIV